ncbi:MAG: FAD binding domain-containing protein [Pseudomonadota bacterium]
MFPAPIDAYERPKTINEALSALTRYDEGEAIFLAGGQSAMQAIKSRMLQPQCIIDLQDIAELKGISAGDGLVIGAMTRYVEIAESSKLAPRFLALQDAAQHIGDRQVRNRGTIGGSLCWNYVSSCMPSVVLALGGRLKLQSADGPTRALEIDDFLLGPLETERADDEILLSIAWPQITAPCGSAYAKWGLVTDALPVVGMCVSLELDNRAICRQARVAIAGLAGGAQRALAAESALVGCDGNENAVTAAFTAAAESAETHGDQNASADYRAYLISRLGREVSAKAFARARSSL